MKPRTFSPLHQTCDSIIQGETNYSYNNLSLLKLKTSQKPNQYDSAYFSNAHTD